MATSKTKSVVYQRRMVRGKPKLVKTRKETLKNTNTSKGSNTGGKPWGSDAAALKSESITEKARTERARIAGRSMDVATLGTTAAQMTRSITGNNYQSTAIQSTPEVAQAVKGGLQEGTSRRDDDEEDEEVNEGFVA